MTARVLIRPKAGMLDPQGKAVERALPALGFDGVATCAWAGTSSSRCDEPDAPVPRCASSCSPTR